MIVDDFNISNLGKQKEVLDNSTISKTETVGGGSNLGSQMYSKIYTRK
jgi:hypothetical protein